MSAITASQQGRKYSSPTKICLCTVCTRWSIKTVSSLVNVAFQQHYPGRRELIFPAHPLFPAHTLTLFLQQIKTLLLIYSYHPLWRLRTRRFRCLGHLGLKKNHSWWQCIYSDLTEKHSYMYLTTLPCKALSQPQATCCTTWSRLQSKGNIVNTPLSNVLHPSLPHCEVHRDSKKLSKTTSQCISSATHVTCLVWNSVSIIWSSLGCKRQILWVHKGCNIPLIVSLTAQ